MIHFNLIMWTCVETTFTSKEERDMKWEEQHRGQRQREKKKGKGVIWKYMLQFQTVRLWAFQHSHTSTPTLIQNVIMLSVLKNRTTELHRMVMGAPEVTENGLLKPLAGGLEKDFGRLFTLFSAFVINGSLLNLPGCYSCWAAAHYISAPCAGFMQFKQPVHARYWGLKTVLTLEQLNAHASYWKSRTPRQTEKGAHISLLFRPCGFFKKRNCVCNRIWDQDKDRQRKEIVPVGQGGNGKCVNAIRVKN